MKHRATLLAAVIAMVSGCATIIGEPTQILPISSTPGEAKIVITDERGTEVFRGTTPTTVTLEKSDGSYWGGKSYTVAISKPGHESRNIRIESRPNGWYLAGNLVFGGLIGWFIVDPFNGDMYTLSPKEVRATMDAETSHDEQREAGSLTVMLLEEVPESLRDELNRIE